MTSSSLLNTFNNLGLATTTNKKSSSATAASDTSTTGVGNTQMLSQADFLKLLTTQLTKQDPTNPSDSNTMLTQMSQIATVSGINSLLSTFQSLSSSMVSDQALQAANLVGKSVNAPGSQALLMAGGTVSGNFTLDTSTTDAKLTITNPKTKEIINQIDLGSLKAGTIPFSWNGKDSSGTLANPGVYKVEVTAMLGGKNTAVATNIDSQVESVSLGSGSNGLKLNLKGLGSVPMTSVKSIS